MKGYLYTEEEILEVMIRLIDVQDMIMSEDLDPDLYDILEEALNILDPEE